MRKKFISLFLVLIMLLSLMPAAVFAGTTVNCSGSCTHKAAIGTTHYDTLADAIAAVPAGTETTITMIADETIAGNTGVTIPANKNIILNLNGKTVSNNATEAKSSATITNNGTLKIVDTTDMDGDGENCGFLTNEATESATGDWWAVERKNWATNTITNYGTLTIESGCVRNTSTGISYCVDNNSSGSTATFNMTGGKLEDKGCAMRLFCNSTTADNIVNISGGTIESKGSTAFWVQLPGNSGQAKKCTLNITGGTIVADTEGYAWYDYSFGDIYDAVNYNVSGGKFGGIIYSAGKTGFIMGGLFSEKEYYDDSDKAVYCIEVFVADGYECVANTDPETKDTYKYIVQPKQVAKIGQKIYTSLAKAIEAVPANNTETTITMLANEAIEGNAGVTIPANKNIILDLNGKTIKNVVTESKVAYVIDNRGTLTIKDATRIGLLTNTVSEGVQPGDPASGHNYCTNIIENNGTLTIESGNIINTGLGSACYAVDNNSADGTLPKCYIKGGLLKNEHYTPVRVAPTNSNKVAFNMTGGIIEGKYGLVLNCNNSTAPAFEIRITDGIIKAKNYAFYTSAANDVTNASVASISIKGGYFGILPPTDPLINIVKYSNFITGGYYTKDVTAYVNTSSHQCVTLSSISTDPGFDENYESLHDAGYTHKVVLYTAPTAETKYVVEYEGESEQKEYHNEQGSAVEAAKEGDAKATVTVSEGGITASIDDKVKIVAITEQDNHVSADPGYEVASAAGITGKTVYTATPLAVGCADSDRNVTGSGVTKTKQTDAKAMMPEAAVTQKVAEIASDVTETNSAIESLTVIETVAKQEAEKINQGIAAKALAKGTSLVVKNTTDAAAQVAAKDISVFVDTYYQTKVTEDKTEEEKPAEKTFTINIKPMYQAYATKVKVTEGTTVGALKVGIDSAKIGEPQELILTGETVTMKVKLPAGFVSSTEETVYVMHVKDDLSKKYYTATIVKEDADFFAIFENKDGFSSFTFSKASLEQTNPGGGIGGGGGAATPKPTEAAIVNPFVDVEETAYYYDAVMWAVENGITSGIDATHFDPKNITTRAQMVAFLWRAAGCPEPTNTTCEFTDVKSTAYYYKAVLWAIEEGITMGTTDTTFSPNKTVTRAQAVAFLARMSGVTDEAAGYTHGFTDVKTTAYYNNAVAWAAENKITEGMTATTFAPNNNCLRGQIVSFLYRYFIK